MSARHGSSLVTLRSALMLLCFAFVVLPVQHNALAQSSGQQQPADSPPSGPPPDGEGGPGGPPPGSSSSGTNSSSGTQTNRPGPPSPAMELDRLIRAMKSADVPLTDVQKVSILGILEDKETAMQSLRTTADRSSGMQQVKALDQAARTAILALLTEAQQKVYANLRQGPPSGPGGTSGTASTSSQGSNTGGPSAFSAEDDGTATDANTGGGIQ